MAITSGASSSGFRKELAPAAALFRALADPTRLSILRRLAAGEARVVDLTTAMNMAQSSVSAHLASLRDCGLVVARPEARQMFYSLAHPELLDLLASAETLLGATDSAVALRPNDGIAASARKNPEGDGGG
ncbi:metalloregulator ArsR/SmtB family transcription factor [Streptomyces sp. N2-109]|uniref:Metalloregulator ArsR/SmtB family transcription factor n=1 Tax=Streptomyces gossypii TaxID=2883101 RepID=A0ABT2JX56_9ACTN|nr:metalloregulator ArsR/SmtB family transcription factor [Streptomyces gossypii]MCT2592039.1 metalloregulator ArsR/SmtB family transcription factor [Streptomyces gossypii]